MQHFFGSTGHDAMLRRLRIFAWVASAGSVGIAALVMAGWEFGVVWLTSILPELVAMKPMTAACFLCCGVSLGLHLRPDAHGREGRWTISRIAARALAILAASCGVATIAEYALGVNYGFEELLFRQAILATHVVHPGRMSLATAVAFALLGVAQVFFESLADAQGRLWQPLTFTVVLFTLVQFLGYLYGASDLYKTFGQNPMAVHTAFVFLLLGLGMFAARGDRGWAAVIHSPLAGGMIARRILPAAVLLPIALGWVRLEGQRMGLYQTEFGLAIFASLNIATFTMVVWFGARSLNSTAQRLAGTNAELAVSEERLRMATDGGGIGTWTWEVASGEMHNSWLCRKICGMALTGEVSMDDALGCVHPEDREMMAGRLEKARETGGTLEMQCRMVWPDGSVHWVASYGRSFTDANGSSLRMEGIVQEITERKYAEEQVKRLAAIVEASEDAIISSDLQGHISSWNPGAERMYGYTAEEVVGKSNNVLTIPGRESEARGLYEKACRGESTSQTETRRRGKDGRILEISLSVSPLRDGQGKVVGVSSIARDITEQRTTERQFRQAQKMEAVGQLAGGVAHDFNNMVMVINSYAQLIKEHPGVGREIWEDADQILRAATRAAAVTRQLLAFGRKQMQDLKVIDLNEVIPHFCKLLPHVLSEEITMAIEPHCEAARVSADQGQLEQVLMNLAVNARDAMPQGGRLRIQIGTAQIGPEYSLQHDVNIVPGRFVVLSVSDSGQGMDAATQARIFEPFFTTKEVGKGTGLGLATVYGIVKQHKGFVWVYSEVGRGTEFKVYLPYCAEEACEEAAMKVAPAESGAGETVLLVEDETSLREVISQYLRSKGYVVLAAENGAAALQMCAGSGQRVDLLLTDFIMPGMRGPEVAREVLKVHAGIAVVFMSGYADRELELGDLQVKWHFLQKPVNLRELARKVRTALDAGVGTAVTESTAAKVR